MKKLFSVLLAMFVVGASATPVQWQLIDFEFNDGGTAYGSFAYDSSTNTFSNIDIYTSIGSMLSGRHYVSTAGTWGRLSDYGILAFSDYSGPNFTRAGWFRIDANIDFDAPPGTVVNQWMAVGAESFCTNSLCSSAANKITNPGESRDTISGYLVARSVPEPSSLVLSILGLGILAVHVTSRRRKL